MAGRVLPPSSALVRDGHLQVPLQYVAIASTPHSKTTAAPAKASVGRLGNTLGAPIAVSVNPIAYTYSIKQLSFRFVSIMIIIISITI